MAVLKNRLARVANLIVSSHKLVQLSPTHTLNASTLHHFARLSSTCMLSSACLLPHGCKMAAALPNLTCACQAGEEKRVR